MSFIKTVLFTFTATIIFALVCGSTLDSHRVQPNCLGCLCEASTQCNVSAGCHVPYPGAYFCGPFLISWAYWADAGKLVIDGDNPDRKGAFENCVNDLYCAADTVRNYMDKFAEESGDCNGDGVVDCVDYAFMHRNGAYVCTNRQILNTDFYKGFDTCWRVVKNAAAPIAASGVLPPDSQLLPPKA